jgi:hypothetical protein
LAALIRVAGRRVRGCSNRPALLERCARLSPGEREAIELVDLMELSGKEAAAALGVSRVPLSRASNRLFSDDLLPAGVASDNEVARLGTLQAVAPVDRYQGRMRDA